MRLSMDKSDRAYNPKLGKRATVLLDGQPVPWCVTADEEEGAVIAQRRTEAGKIITDPDTLAPVRETRRGVVKIVVREP